MRTSNILMAPGQFNNQPGYPGNFAIRSDGKRPNENILPPLEYKNHSILTSNSPNSNASTSNPLANKRQLTPASVLPNLKSVIENLSSENLNAMKSSNISLNSPKTSANYVNNHPYLPAPGSIGNSSQYPGARNNSNPAIYQQNFNAPVKFIIHRGITIYQGDHVSIRGSDSQVYFAVLMDFWLTENGKRYCTLRWLLPKPKASFTSALQERFELGPIHERVEAMETILDVFYSPYRDQMTAENIRKKFLMSDDNNETTGVLASIQPPAQLINAIKSLSSEDLSTSSTRSNNPFPSAASNQTSPSSRLFKSSSATEEVQMNPISVESSEIAAKMLLSMN